MPGWLTKCRNWKKSPHYRSGETRGHFDMRMDRKHRKYLRKVRRANG